MFLYEGLNSHCDIGECGDCLNKVHLDWDRHWDDVDKSRELKIRDMHFNCFIETNTATLNQMKGWRNPKTGESFAISCWKCHRIISCDNRTWR